MCYVMSQWIPSLVDLPMSLGDHLGELRRRLLPPVVTLVVMFAVAFAYQAELFQIMLWPLLKAINLAGEDAIKVGFDPAKGARLLVVQELAEAATSAARISFYTALAVSMPVLLYQIWKFIAVGLTAKERRLAFLFVPLGVILFYLGMAVGYQWGLPYFYAFLIAFTAANEIVQYNLRLSEYIDTFVTWTIAFGLVMDIPWLVMVLCRTGVVTPAQLAKGRRYVIMINVVLAAIITPTSDLLSLMALFVPMQLLFEIGLIVSYIMLRNKPAIIVEE